MAKSFFGTDGIRGTVNQNKINGDMFFKFGLAAGTYFRNLKKKKQTAVIAKDTRLSGYTLEPALVSGLASAGMHIFTLGPLPTNGLAMLTKKFKIKTDVSFVNLGGIANISGICGGNIDFAGDIGPAMCLIDKWIRTNSNKKYDEKGKLARAGKINKIRLQKGLQNYKSIKKNSLDIKDFNLSFVNGLSLKDGAATLTEYTAQILSNQLMFHAYSKVKIILCGGGRKNKFLIKKIKKKIPYKVLLIDNYKINGDFVESQAFGYLAVRSFLKLPITYPETTGCKRPCTGGVTVKTF